MPITKSAKKALRQSEVKRVYNLRRKKKMDDAVKEIKKLIAGKKVTEAKKLLPKAYQAIDKAAKGNTIKKNKASRSKSQVSAMIKNAEK